MDDRVENYAKNYTDKLTLHLEETIGGLDTPSNPEVIQTAANIIYNHPVKIIAAKSPIGMLMLAAMLTGNLQLDHRILKDMSITGNDTEISDFLLDPRNNTTHNKGHYRGLESFYFFSKYPEVSFAESSAKMIHNTEHTALQASPGVGSWYWRGGPSILEGFLGSYSSIILNSLIRSAAPDVLRLRLQLPPVKLQQKRLAFLGLTPKVFENNIDIYNSISAARVAFYYSTASHSDILPYTGRLLSEPVSIESDMQKALVSLVRETAGYITLPDVLIYSNKPIKIHSISGLKKTDNIAIRSIHNSNGMAIEFEDKFGIYMMHGIVVNPLYVKTPADDINPAWIFQEPDVDARRELVTKLGIQRLLPFGKVVEESGKYKLINMADFINRVRFEGSTERDVKRLRSESPDFLPYLLMENATLSGVLHLEGVDESCRTIQEAINWRAHNRYTEWKPWQLS